MSGIVIDLQDEILPMRYALSRKQLQSDDKDTALEMLTEIRDKNSTRKEAGCNKGSACWALLYLYRARQKAYFYFSA